MAEYPIGYLPSPLVLYSDDLVPSVSGIEMESGFLRNVNKFSELREMVSVEFSFSQAQLDFWNGWWMHKINNGTDSFTIDLLLNSAIENFTVVITSGEYQSSRVSSDQWTVSMEFRIEDTKIISEAALDAILA
jgi:hypothetical protein